MTQEHPITPPPELVQQWAKQMITPDDGNLALDFDWFATQAARWGADQELEACCEWMADETPTNYINALRAARRPKPTSLKEQALAVLDHTQKGYGLAEVDLDTIRRALESLPD